MANVQDDFDTNLLRYIAATAYAQLGLSAAREMFGKSYFSLGGAEKTAVDNATFAMIAGNFQTLTAKNLTMPPPAPVGFQPQPPIPPTQQNPKP